MVTWREDLCIQLIFCGTVNIPGTILKAAAKVDTRWGVVKEEYNTSSVLIRGITWVQVSLLGISLVGS
jgi:hypothetical protein